MKTTVNFETFANDLRESFSIEAIEILFEYFEQYEDSCDCELEFDPVTIRCEFTESTTEEVLYDYGYMMDETDEHDTKSIKEFLNDKTILLDTYEKDGLTFFVYQQF